MPITMPTLSGAYIKSDDFHDRLNIIQKFINVEIDTTSDLASSGFNEFETKHVYKPDLFGSPSPKMSGVSSQVHWRNVANDWTTGVTMSSGCVGRTWVGVPGLCTRLKLTERAQCVFTSSFYVFEMGGVTEQKGFWKYKNKARTKFGLGPWIEDEITDDSGATKKDAGDRERDKFGHEYKVAAHVSLFIDGVRQSSTNREVHTNNVLPHGRYGQRENKGWIMSQMISRHQQTISKRFTLEKGIHDVGIMCRPREIDHISLRGEAFQGNQKAAAQEAKNIYFLARSMVVDVIYDSDSA